MPVHKKLSDKLLLSKQTMLKNINMIFHSVNPFFLGVIYLYQGKTHNLVSLLLVNTCFFLLNYLTDKPTWNYVSFSMISGFYGIYYGDHYHYHCILFFFLRAPLFFRTFQRLYFNLYVFVSFCFLVYLAIIQGISYLDGSDEFNRLTMMLLHIWVGLQLFLDSIFYTRQKEREGEMMIKIGQEIQAKSEVKQRFILLLSHTAKNKFSGILPVLREIREKIEDKVFQILPEKQQTIDRYLDLSLRNANHCYEILFNTISWQSIILEKFDVSVTRSRFNVQEFIFGFEKYVSRQLFLILEFKLQVKLERNTTFPKYAYNDSDLLLRVLENLVWELAGRSTIKKSDLLFNYDEDEEVFKIKFLPITMKKRHRYKIHKPDVDIKDLPLYIIRKIFFKSLGGIEFEIYHEKKREIYGFEMSCHLPIKIPRSKHERYNEDDLIFENKKKPISVLICEDNEIIRKYLRKYVEIQGKDSKTKHFIIECNDGYEGYQAIKKGRINPDIIFTDYDMPIMNGERFAMRIIKENLLKKNWCKIYLITGISFRCDKFIKKGESFLFDSVISKPVSYNSIKNLLDNCVSRRNSEIIRRGQDNLYIDGNNDSDLSKSHIFKDDLVFQKEEEIRKRNLSRTYLDTMSLTSRTVIHKFKKDIRDKFMHGSRFNNKNNKDNLELVEKQQRAKQLEIEWNNEKKFIMNVCSDFVKNVFTISKEKKLDMLMLLLYTLYVCFFAFSVRRLLFSLWMVLLWFLLDNCIMIFSKYYFKFTDPQTLFSIQSAVNVLVFILILQDFKARRLLCSGFIYNSTIPNFKIQKYFTVVLFILIIIIEFLCFFIVDYSEPRTIREGVFNIFIEVSFIYRNFLSMVRTCEYYEIRDGSFFMKLRELKFEENRVHNMIHHIATEIRKPFYTLSHYSKKLFTKIVDSENYMGNEKQSFKYSNKLEDIVHFNGPDKSDRMFYYYYFESLRSFGKDFMNLFLMDSKSPIFHNDHNSSIQIKFRKRNRKNKVWKDRANHGRPKTIRETLRFNLRTVVKKVIFDETFSIRGLPVPEKKFVELEVNISKEIHDINLCKRIRVCYHVFEVFLINLIQNSIYFVNQENLKFPVRLAKTIKMDIKKKIKKKVVVNCYVDYEKNELVLKVKDFGIGINLQNKKFLNKFILEEVYHQQPDSLDNNNNNNQRNKFEEKTLSNTTKIKKKKKNKNNENEEKQKPGKINFKLLTKRNVKEGEETGNPKLGIGLLCCQKLVYDICKRYNLEQDQQLKDLQEQLQKIQIKEEKNEDSDSDSDDEEVEDDEKVANLVLKSAGIGRGTTVSFICKLSEEGRGIEEKRKQEEEEEEYEGEGEEELDKYDYDDNNNNNNNESSDGDEEFYDYEEEEVNRRKRRKKIRREDLRVFLYFEENRMCCRMLEEMLISLGFSKENIFSSNVTFFFPSKHYGKKKNNHKGRKNKKKTRRRSKVFVDELIEEISDNNNNNSNNSNNSNNNNELKANKEEEKLCGIIKMLRSINTRNYSQVSWFYKIARAEEIVQQQNGQFDLVIVSTETLNFFAYIENKFGFDLTQNGNFTVFVGDPNRIKKMKKNKGFGDRFDAICLDPIREDDFKRILGDYFDYEFTFPE